MAKQVKIPKLPYGQGSMAVRPNGTIVYKKRLGNPKKEYSVYAKTPAEAMTKMAELERSLEEEKFIKETQTLYEAMSDWLVTYKKPKLKKTSYDTLKKTIDARIKDFKLGNTRVTAIDSDMIQKHLNTLNEDKNLSYSTIKKCHDALNDFFRNMYLQRKIDYNPMDVVVMLNKENVIKEIKQVQFFEKDDIKKFIEEATSLCNNKKPKYQYGFCLSANIFLGMRGGELIALKWEDIDFDKDTIYIHNNLQMVTNTEYDEDKKEEMELRGINKFIFEMQSLKNYQNRHIHMNEQAKKYLLLQKQHSKYTNHGDYVCCTKHGTHSQIQYLSSNIEQIEKASNMSIREKGTHVIRHTCASLYFRAGVRIELISALLGHSVEVCRETYIHFVEEQKKEAVQLINDYNVKFTTE